MMAWEPGVVVGTRGVGDPPEELVPEDAAEPVWGMAMGRGAAESTDCVVMMLPLASLKVNTAVKSVAAALSGAASTA
jgi:hypothetical protein